MIGWPNPKTLARAANRGWTALSLGPLPRWVLPLRTARHLQPRYSLPKPLAAAAGAATDFSLGLARALGTVGHNVRVESISAFDDGFDPVTWAGMAAPEFWSPHDAEFLNWRYVAHPIREYACLAACEGDDPCGYSVVRLAPNRAVLMELAFPPNAPHVAHTLIRRAAKIAREAGCPKLDFETTPSWPYAALLKRAGFMEAPSKLYLAAYGRSFPHEETALEHWRLVPGDQDAL
jgi:hypothetical protein